MAHNTHEHIVVIIGAGGLGVATARRLACGRKVVFGSRSEKSLETAKSLLEWDGHRVETHQVDITNTASVNTFAQKAAAAGTLDVVVHTSGVSPATASTQQVWDIDLLGTAYVLDAFLEHVSPGTSVICTTSMAGHMTHILPPISTELERHFAIGPSSQLLQHQDFKPIASIHTGLAYSIAKRANILRVQGFASAYGAKGARLNSVSPGLIMTRMGQAELASDSGDYVKAMFQLAAIKRGASPEEIVSAIAFLASREAAYVTSSDILVDGGSVAGSRWNMPEAGGN